MTDNDIIKALEEWSERGMTFCNVGMSEFARNILGLINRQKAKIKALQMDNAQLQSDIINATQNNDHIATLYEEAKQEVGKAKQKVIETCKKLQTARAEIERLQKYNTDIAFKHYNDGIKEFAHYLIDRSEGRDIKNADLPDLVCEMLSNCPEDNPNIKNQP